jgi:hypothetical protein
VPRQRRHHATPSAIPSAFRNRPELNTFAPAPTRAEHPRLYDELIRFRKGAKRVNRLRLLAYDGLLVQQGLLKLPGQTLSETPGSIGFDGDADGVTNGLFEPSVDDQGGP